MSDDKQPDIILDLNGPISSKLVLTGGVKFLIQDFKDKNGVVYSIACPNVMVKMHDKEENNGESGDRHSGSEKEAGEENQNVEEGSSSDNDSEAEEA